MELEKINKVGLMNVLKLSSGPQPPAVSLPSQGIESLLKARNFWEAEKTNSGMKQGSKYEKLEKKVKVGANGERVRASWGYLPSVQEKDEQRPSSPSQRAQFSLISPVLAVSSQGMRSPMSDDREALDEDKPMKILSLKYDQDKQDFIYFVEWKERYDGSKAKNSYLNKEEIMRRDPGLIVSYYEKQIASSFQSIVAH